MPILIAIAVIVVVVLVISWLQDRRARMRAQQRRARAEILGLQPNESAASLLRRHGRGLILFAQGETSRIENVMQGHLEGVEEVEFTLFDYSFDISVGGRYVRAWKQTVLHLASEDLHMPTFTLLPDEDVALMLTNASHDTVRDRLLGAVSARFDDHPVFNEKLHLQGADRKALQSAFDDDLLTFFEAHTDLCTEGGGSQLFFYYYDEALSAAQLDDFVHTALEAYRLMRGT